MYIQSLESGIHSLRSDGMRIHDIAHWERESKSVVSSWSSGRSKAHGATVEEKLSNSAKILATYTSILQDIAANHDRPIERICVLRTFLTPDWALHIATATATGMLHAHAPTPDQMILPIVYIEPNEASFITDLSRGEVHVVSTHTDRGVDYINIYPDAILRHAHSVLFGGVELTNYPEEVY